MFRTLRRLFYKTSVRFLIKVTAFFGYDLLIMVSKKHKESNSDLLNLNIGAGEYVIDGFASLDFYSEHYYPNKKKFLKNRMPYDIRSDTIPFEDNVVDNIYVSHVIEHIEDKFVKHLFVEAKRVLKPGGVLRIACPDAKFLFQVSNFENDYWSWRYRTISNENYDAEGRNLHQLDFLIRELATPRCRYNRNKIHDLELHPSDIENLDYHQFLTLLSGNLRFREQFPGDHINFWDIDLISALGVDCGFTHVLESKQFGSVSSAMSTLEFDRSAPNMSLYVDLVK